MVVRQSMGERRSNMNSLVNPKPIAPREHLSTFCTGNFWMSGNVGGGGLEAEAGN